MGTWVVRLTLLVAHREWLVAILGGVSLVEQGLQRRHYTAHVDRLPDTTSSSHADGIDGSPRSHGHDDHGYIPAARLVVACLHKGATAHVGNVQAHQHRIGYGPAQAPERGVAIRRDLHKTVKVPQYRARRVAACHIIVNQQNAVHGTDDSFAAAAATKQHPGG